MNIFIDIRTLLTAPRTGVGEYVYELLSEIFRQDKANQYFLYYNSFKENLKIPEWSAPNIHFVRTKIPNKLLNISSAVLHRPKLDKLITKKTGRVGNVFFSPHINFTTLTNNIRLALTVHDLTFTLYPNFFSLRQRLWHTLSSPNKQIERANLIFTPSQNTKRDIIKNIKINPDKIEVIYPGLGKNFLAAEIPLASNKYNLTKNYLLFLGTVEPRKNVLAVIRAFEKIAKDIPHELAIAGKFGYKSNQIKKYIKNSACRQRIKLIGYVPDEDKPALYQQADIFIYPSFYEGFGFPVLEAMSAGIPVITTARGSLPEIGGDSVYYVNPQKPNEIAEQIKNIISGKSAVTQLDIERLKEKFNWRLAAEKILQKLTAN